MWRKILGPALMAPFVLGGVTVLFLVIPTIDANVLIGIGIFIVALGMFLYGLVLCDD